MERPAEPGDFNEETGEYTILVDFGSLLERHKVQAGRQAFARYGLKARSPGLSRRRFVVTGTERAFKYWDDDYSQSTLDFGRVEAALSFFEQQRLDRIPRGDLRDSLRIRTVTCPWCGQLPAGIGPKSTLPIAQCTNDDCPRAGGFWHRTWTRQENLDHPDLAPQGWGGPWGWQTPPPSRLWDTKDRPRVHGVLDLSGLTTKKAVDDVRRAMRSYGVQHDLREQDPGPVFAVNATPMQFDLWKAWYERRHHTPPALTFPDENAEPSPAAAADRPEPGHAPGKRVGRNTPTGPHS